MKPQNKNIIFNPSSCVSGEKLLAYAKNELDHKGIHEVEEHLIDCELCSDALEGLALISGPAVIHETVEKIKSLTKSKPKSVDKDVFRIWLAAASVVIIISVTLILYHKSYSPQKPDLANRISIPPKVEKKPEPVVRDTVPAVKANSAQQAERSLSLTTISAERKQKSSDLHLAAVQADVEKLNSGSETIATEILSNDDNSVAGQVSYEQEAPAADNAPAAPVMKAVPLKSRKDDFYRNKNAERESGVLFIEGLKTADYKLTMPDSLFIADRQGVEAKFENYEVKKSASDEKAPDRKFVSYHGLLESGLRYFNLKNYSKALDVFKTILAERSQDHNALFYAALCYDQLAQYALAEKFLSQITNNRESVFFEEAQWHLALVYLKESRAEDGRNLLKKIIDANGFYGGRAGEKLKEIR